jgi:glycosyltransferase involved in cell wall biosynthesis
MRIGFFTYGMNERMTGIARYAVELTRALRALGGDLEITLLNPHPDSRHPWYREFDIYPLPKLRLLPAAATLGNAHLHRAALDLNLDILHDPCGIAPFLAFRSRYKRVTTVHDAIPFIYPETQPLLSRLLFHTLVRASGRTADAVLTVSQAAANDLAHHARIPETKLFAIPNGVTLPDTALHLDVAGVLERLGVRAPYFLCVGALHPRKNVGRLLAAFHTLRQEGSAAQLVIVGPPYWGGTKTLHQVVRAAQADDGVVFTGFVSDEVLDALYCGAHALVFVSLYEGFGLPALEAMARSTPVISSNTSSLPEVVGDAGLFVDPFSVEEIAAAMQRLLVDSNLHCALREQGLSQVRKFTWERAAQETLAVYKKVLA